MNRSKTLRHLLACGVLLAITACHGGAGTSTFTTKEHGTETLKFGSAIAEYNTILAFVDCKVTCDMVAFGTLNTDKISAVCPGNYRWVDLRFSHKDYKKEMKEVPSGKIQKNGDVHLTASLSTKNNTGSRGYDITSAKEFAADVNVSGSTATATIDFADPDTTLKGTITAQVCPKK